MKILFNFPHYPVSAGRFLADAAKRLGHDVRTVGEPAERFNGWNKTPVAVEYVHVPDGPAQHRFPDWTPDLVVDVDEYARPPERQRAYASVPHVAYNPSNNVCDISGPFDMTFVAAHDGPALKADGKRVRWAGCAYDPTLHRGGKIPWEDREHDVCFIGSAWQNRQLVLRSLRAAGISVYQDMGPIYTEYVAAYHNSRIGLVNAGDYPLCNMRLYETPAMGALPLVARSSYDPRLRADDALLFFDDLDSVVETVASILACPAAGKRLLARAVAWVQPHTWDALMKYMIESITEVRSQ